MKNLFIRTILTFFISLYAFAQETPQLAYYLPHHTTYNPAIPTPQSILGYVPGKWHVTHDQLVTYMKVLAAASPRIHIENRGHTFEDRPLLLLTITSEKNHQNLDTLKQQHLQLTQQKLPLEQQANMPVVVYQGFSIHGNESSGSNASLITAYHLAAAQGEAINNLLDSTIILLDPSMNPDGLQRFAYWANSNKSKNMSTDPQDREYKEIWPGARTNHYWFDMNRDWLPVQLPESKARIKTFHEWYPNILTDHHEMGPNSTFFFQPGVPSRTHPLTPKLNQELTKKIGNYHAVALDKIGSLYYTEENFDDFYYGKGSTYPDINGGIGILFEQASSRGHRQETANGILTFPFTIKNQFTAALSTLDAAYTMRKELIEYQNNFFNQAKKATLSGSYIFGNEKDAATTYHLAELLKQHRIQYHELEKDVVVNKKNYKKGYSYIVPRQQQQHQLIEAIFEKRTKFKDSLFYDVSAWTLPLAFGLDYAKLTNTNAIGKEVTDLHHRATPDIPRSHYGYLMEWHEYYSPAVLYALVAQGIRAKVGMRPFKIGQKSYDYGTIFIPLQNQQTTPETIHALLSKLTKQYHVDITAVSSGLTKGINLGSNQFSTIKLPKIALLTGTGVTSYDAGEIWHLLDQRYNIPITKITTTNLKSYSLARYTHLIIPNTQTHVLSKEVIEKLKTWVQSGGTLIGYKNAAHIFNTHHFMQLEFIPVPHIASNITFEQKQDFTGAQVIGGAILEANIDRSHPINFGYKNNTISLFRNSKSFIKPAEQSYENPIQYTRTPLLSGYVSKKNLSALASTVPFKHTYMGKGDVILFTDNTNFRAFWYGTNKLLMNALFFSNKM